MVVDQAQTATGILTGAVLSRLQRSLRGEAQSFGCGIATRREAVGSARTGLTSCPFRIYAAELQQAPTGEADLIA